MASVLVIDDDPRVCDFLQLALTRAGYDVRLAAGGEEGLAAYRERPADVVVCDLLMPGMDGIQVIRELRRMSPEVGVIAMSGGRWDQGMDLLALAVECGAVLGLEKPLTAERVTSAVRDVLGG